MQTIRWRQYSLHIRCRTDEYHTNGTEPKLLWTTIFLTKLYQNFHDLYFNGKKFKLYKKQICIMYINHLRTYYVRLLHRRTYVRSQLLAFDRWVGRHCQNIYLFFFCATYIWLWPKSQELLPTLKRSFYRILFLNFHYLDKFKKDTTVTRSLSLVSN